MNVLMNSIALGVTILWGATVALLGILHQPAVSVVAVVGGPLIAVMWIVLAQVKRARGTQRASRG